MVGLMMDYQLTIDKILEHAHRMHPRKQITTKLPDGSFHRYTYADMHRRVKKLSSALAKLGVQPGDRVGTFAWNHYQHVELYFGIPGAGAVCHTLNIRLFPEQLAYIVNHADDQVVFVDASLLPLYEKVLDEVQGVKHYVIMNAAGPVTTKLPNVIYYEDLIATGSEEFAWRSTDEQMAMGMCYTSGTTGNPKGALYSHRSMFMHTLMENQADALGTREADVVLVVVPQFHAMAWGLPFACTMTGADMVLPGPFLQPEPLAAMIEAEKVTVAAGVPTIWNGLYYELKNRPRDISYDSRPGRRRVGHAALAHRRVRERAGRQRGPRLGHDRALSSRHRGQSAEAAPGSGAGREVECQSDPRLRHRGRRDAHRRRRGPGIAVGRQDHG